MWKNRGFPVVNIFCLLAFVLLIPSPAMLRPGFGNFAEFLLFCNIHNSLKPSCLFDITILRAYINFFSLATFYYFNQKRKINREKRQERLEENLDQLLTALRKVKDQIHALQKDDGAG